MSSSSASWSTNAFLKGGPEVLIKEVFARRPIWDLRSHAHHNRELVSKLWEEISEILGVSTDTVKTKWKHLRDNFRTELKKTVRTSADPRKSYQSQWTYFNDLLFLEEQMMRKITHTYGASPSGYDMVNAAAANGETSLICMSPNIGDMLGTDNESLLDKHSNILLGHSLFDDSSMHEQIALWAQHEEESTQRKRKRSHDSDISDSPSGNCPEQVVNEHATQSTNLQTHQIHQPITTNQTVIDTNNDDDFHFMMSLLPYVRSLSLSKKMHLRLKFQELICNFIYNVKVPAVNEPAKAEITANCLKIKSEEIANRITISSGTNTEESPVMPLPVVNGSTVTAMKKGSRGRKGNEKAK